MSADGQPGPRRYANPIARDGDFADPFVLRYNGRYYLYATNPDIRCWSSANLVDWTLEGPTIADDVFPGLVPFAPEVTYSNGSFYLITSPSGHGHHVLRSDRPTGPFELISGNVGHAIDGNVLIDDDGSWYFYWAGDEGIWGCAMPTPTTFGEPVLTGPFMGGWTEGPFVSRHGDTYRMTLTGNHYLNDGYRINAAVSRHPLGPFIDDPLNPVLLSVRGAVTGVGHSSSVTGPDLLSTYLMYHNLNPDESRDLNLDRQVANVDSAQVLGPTTSAPVPASADVVVDWCSGVGVEGWDVVGALVVDGDRARLSGDRASATWHATIPDGAFVAEINLAGSPGAPYGIELGMSGTALRFEIAPERNSVAVHAAGSTGPTVIATSALPAGFAHDRLHCYRIVREGDSFVLFVDGRRQLECESVVAPGSAIRIFSDGGNAALGYCGLSAGSLAGADRTAVKPVPGRFWAALGRVPHPALATLAGPARYAVVRLEAGVVADYELDVARAGEYRIFVTGEFAAGDTLDIVTGDGSTTARIVVEQATGVVSTTVSMMEGATPLRLSGVAGAPTAALISVGAATPEVAFELSEPAAVRGAGKLLVAPGPWHEVEINARLELQPGSSAFRGGVIFRSSQLSEGGAGGDDLVLGANFLLGYSVEFRQQTLVLSRHAYDARELAAVPIRMTSPVDLAVRMSGGHIEVLVDGEVVITGDDPLPHLLGGVGLRASGGTVTATSLTVTPISPPAGTAGHYDAAGLTS